MQKVLDYIRDRIASGLPITLKDIAMHCGWSSTATAAGVVRNLRAWKLIRRNRKGGRTIHILAEASSYKGNP